MQLSLVDQFGNRNTKPGKEQAHVNRLFNKQDNWPLEAANVAGMAGNSWRSWQGLVAAEDHPLTRDSQCEGQIAHLSCT